MKGQVSSQTAAGKLTDRLPHVCDPARVTIALLVFVALLSSLVLLAAPTARAAAGPSWRVESVPDPTAFSSTDIITGECAPCDKYQIRLTDVGGAPASNDSSKPITVTDTLPEGVTTSEFPRSGNREEEWACEPGGAGQTSIKCTLEQPPFGPAVVGALKQAPALTVYTQVEAGVPANSVRPNLVKVEGGGAATVEESVPTLLNRSGPLSFGLTDFGSYLADLGGGPDTQAAGHPNALRTSFDVLSAFNPIGNTFEATRSVEDVKEVIVDLPVGLVGDPQAVPQCPLHDLVTGAQSSGCPAASQVGWLSFNASGSYEGEFIRQGRQNVPIYNMVPERGYPAEFGFPYAEKSLLMYTSVVGNGAATHVRVSIPGIPASQLLSFQGAVATFFGNPTVQDSLPSSPVAFLRNSSQCSAEPLVTSIHVDSWQNQGSHNSDGTPAFLDSAWQSDSASTPAVEGCGTLHFNPTISLTPDVSQADAPTGLGVDLEVSQSGDPSIPATPDLMQVVVKLPPGMVISPSAANGLGACSPTQIGLENNDTPTCPESSKVATVRVKTPLLAEELEGSVYLAQQGNAGPAQGSNPFNTLLAGYIVVEGSGVVLKIPGKIEADEQTGQLTATFDESPQLPFSDFKLHFESGPRAPLSNPSACGTYTPQATLSAWSGQTVRSNRSFVITQGENSAACPDHQFAPSFTAGTSNNQAGAYSPFSVTFSRSDEDQTLGGVTVHTPPGLLGKIAGVSQCGETQANAGTCGADSLIGHTTVGAGPGADPFYVGGNVYLTGPYKSAPFGLSIVVPVVAGPFNLGTEVVRAAIAVDPHTAQITVTSDPLPTIKQGIPFQIRTVNVTIDRLGFTFNPTNCTPASVGATIASTAGTSAGVSSPFQAANCASLKFKPGFLVSTARKASKAGGASLDVKVTYPTGPEGTYANIKSVKVDLPKQLPSRLTTLQKACLAATFEANPASCPAASDVGMAKASTPVLSAPLSGPAYLVSHGNEAFPDLEIVLQGEGVALILDGNTNIKKGITSSTFKAIPDAPVSGFELKLPTGPHSVLATNLPASAKYSLCGQKLAMPTAITGQNGAVVKQATKIAVNGCPKSKKARKKTKATSKKHR